ncbi:MAG: phosphoribosyltransferase family protein [Pseudomonadota bacterium]
MLYEGTGRRIVLALKHGDRLDLLRTVSGWMRRAGGALCEDADIIAPIPLHWRRFVARRYNQSAELARQGVLSARADRVPDLLRRVRWTPPQEGMGRETRFQTQHGALALTPRHRDRVAGAHVLLIDDVMTSGATLGAATEALRPAGPASISVLVLARVAQLA